MKKILLVAGFFILPATMDPQSYLRSTNPVSNDSRLVRLKEYFRLCQCPVGELSAEFIQAADENGLDWRLLPSIAVVESSGGKNYRNNNVFGWDNCRQKFTSVRHGIHHVARQLSQSPVYRHKSLDRVLRTYNRVGDYPSRVKRVMRILSPDVTD